MTNPIHIFLLLLLAVNFFCGQELRAESILTAISRNDASGRVQLAFSFDRLPGFQMTTNGRRIDLIFPETTPAATLAPVVTDDKLIRLVTRMNGSTTVVSSYFRYMPQHVTSQSRKESGVLTIDVLLGNQQTASSPELSAQAKNARAGQSPAAASTTPLRLSQYAKNWRAFFTDYVTPLPCLPPPNLHLPPFPLIAGQNPELTAPAWLSEEMQALARSGQWQQLSQLLRASVDKQRDERAKEELVLTYAETLVRAGEYREPYMLLQRIALSYPDSPLARMATLLLITLQATHNGAIDAFYDVHTLQPQFDTTPYANDLTLMAAELALMANLPKEAESQLNKPALADDPKLATLRQVRQADLLALTGAKAKALTLYQDLIGRTDLVARDPMALAHFADALDEAHRYAEAATRFQELADLRPQRPSLDVILFRLAQCQLRLPKTSQKARGDLQQIQDAFPGSEGAARAQLKLTDLAFVGGKQTPDTLGAVYANFAANGSTVGLREEAAFKRALVNRLTGAHRQSVDQCMAILRQYQFGPLRTETTALLLEQLPDLLRQLVRQGEYVTALVLAKQNKAMFVQGWLDIAILTDLAQAYSQLGMDEETAQTYQYLFEVSGDADKEKLFLPLLKSLTASEHWPQVLDYADRYLQQYPKGRDRTTIFACKAEALFAMGRSAEAMNLLEQNQGPLAQELRLLKARILFADKQWSAVIKTLTQPGLGELDIQSPMQDQLAEAYFQAGEDQQAAALYSRIAARTKNTEQARYRLAQLALKANDRQQALNLLKGLTEENKDSLWTKLAREEIAILSLEQP